MPDLTKKQVDILARADKFGHIYEGDYSICPGIHFCPDWDGLPVCIDSPEADGCNCGRLDKLKKEREVVA